MQKYPLAPILIIDDEIQTALSISIALKTGGLNNVESCNNPLDADSVIKEKKPGIVLMDLNMPGKSGFELLDEIKSYAPETSIIIITGADDVNTAVKCMKCGADDYLVKPFSKETLLACVRRVIDIYDLKNENTMISKNLLDSNESSENSPAFASIISGNSKMHALFKYCEAIAPGAQTVLINGETGTGKELFAHAIHQLSGRQGKFMAVNLAGIDASVFSDTLFGHVKGAYTGADNCRKGLIEETAGGTLFLDEIGDLQPETQLKLLRLLQEKEYSPVGSDIIKTSTSRIITATHKNLELMVRNGQFRNDLYYRLKTHIVSIPPLRDRTDDLELLVEHFSAEASRELGKKKTAIHPELISMLRNYKFPGNIRELKAMIFDAVSNNASGVISVSSFREKLFKDKEASIADCAIQEQSKFSFPARLPTIKQLTKELVLEAIKRTGGNQSTAAGLLGITQQALSRRLKNMNQADTDED